MSAGTEKDPVVVATDGSPSALRGVHYAALEARRLDTVLKVVHVVPAYVPVGPMPMIPDGALQEYGHNVLSRSEATAHRAANIEVRTSLVGRSRISGLVEASKDAQVLVLGSRSLSMGERIWTGATVAGVAARATCPVVVIPEEWAPRDPATMSRVLVGFKSVQHAPVLFAHAFALAKSRGAEVRILHAWQLPMGYDDVVANADVALEWGREARDVITPVVADLKPTYPDVPVSIEVLHQRPIDALVEASAHADRLLLMRPAHGARVHHLGAVTRALLHSSRCPIEILGPSMVVPETDETAGLVLERGGALQR